MCRAYSRPCLLLAYETYFKQNTNYTAFRKKNIKMFFVISPIQLKRYWRNLVYRFLNKFAENDINVFQLTWTMSLHYLVKLEMLITHVLCTTVTNRYQKKLQNLSQCNCGFQICRIWIQLITGCMKYCKRRCTKHSSLIRSYRRHHWRMAATMTTWYPAWPTPFSVAVSIRPDYGCVFSHLLLQ